MAALCEAQDDQEAYLALNMQAGEALWGLYPPRPWVAAGRPAGLPACCPDSECQGNAMSTMHPHEAPIRRYFAADYDALMACFTPADATTCAGNKPQPPSTPTSKNIP